jgi:hypothetical protein
MFVKCLGVAIFALKEDLSRACKSTCTSTGGHQLWNDTRLHHDPSSVLCEVYDTPWCAGAYRGSYTSQSTEDHCKFSVIALGRGKVT